MTTEGPSLPWPSDEEMENAPRLHGLSFYERIKLACLAVEPDDLERDGMGATTVELAEYLRADESVAPLTPHMRALLAALLDKIPDRKTVGNRGPGIWSAAIREVARLVLEDKKLWRRGNPDRGTGVPSSETRAMIEHRIDSGDSPFHQACRANPGVRHQAIQTVERHLAKRDRM